MIEKCFYVYVHRRATDGALFYIGKGKGSRLHHHYGKSKWWNAIAAKHGWYAEKLYDGLTEQCAYTFEKALIHANKNKVCNLAEGGVGGSGFKAKSKEHIAKVALRQTGRPKSEATRNKISKKAKERLSDSRNHWHFRSIVSLWKHAGGDSFTGDHFELSVKTGLSLGALKKVQSGARPNHRGWTCHEV